MDIEKIQEVMNDSNQVYPELSKKLNLAVEDDIVKGEQAPQHGPRRLEAKRKSTR